MINYILFVLTFFSFLFATDLAYAGPQSPNEAQYREIKNTLTNPGFENASSTWSKTGSSTWEVVTVAAEVGTGSRSMQWDASAASEELISNAVTLTAGLYARSCLAKIDYINGDENIDFAITDGTNTLNSVTLATSSTYTSRYLSFVCPSSGTVRIELQSTADAAEIHVDDAYIGLNYLLTELSQANFVGSAYFATTANCIWVRTNAALGAFGTDADCPGPTVNDNPGPGTIQTTDADLPKFTVNDLPPGRYLVTIMADASPSGAVNVLCLAINDGTTTSEAQCAQASNTGYPQPFTIQGHFEYDTTANRSFEVYGAIPANTAQLHADTVHQNLNFSLYRFPSDSEQAIRLKDTGWYVDANIGGANFTMSSAAQTSYIEATDAGITLTVNSGSAAAWVPCATTNDSSGTTCSAGNESLGIVFWPPRAGKYEVCADFGHYSKIGSGSGINPTFQLIHTPNAAQTYTQEGKSRISSTRSTTAPDTSEGTRPFHLCGIFDFTSTGKKTVRLMYEQTAVGTVLSNLLLADESAIDGQRDIHFTVKPLAPMHPTPILANSVVTDNVSPFRIVSANVTYNAGTPELLTQSGDWVDSFTDNATGDTTINVKAGTFTTGGHITCVANPNDNGAQSYIGTISGIPTASAVRVITRILDNTASDITFYVICMGEK